MEIEIMYSEVVSAEDLDIAARTVWGEARGEGFEGMVAVAHVIANRALKGGWWGATLEEVCKKPWQFSAWNDNDPNREKLVSLSKTHPEYLMALQAVAVALVADEDPTLGACHYHTKNIDPAWASGAEASAIIGNHRYYAGIR
jgi:N-acetylmuramoyl-L-alanine amidase